MDISINLSFWIRIRMDLYLPKFLDQDPRFCEIWNRFQIQVLKMPSNLEKKHSLNVFLLMEWALEYKTGSGIRIKKSQMLDPDPYIRNIVSKRHAGMHNDQNS